MRCCDHPGFQQHFQPQQLRTRTVPESPGRGCPTYAGPLAASPWASPTEWTLRTWKSLMTRGSSPQVLILGYGDEKWHHEGSSKAGGVWSPHSYLLGATTTAGSRAGLRIAAGGGSDWWPLSPCHTPMNRPQAHVLLGALKGKSAACCPALQPGVSLPPAVTAGSTLRPLSPSLTQQPGTRGAQDSPRLPRSPRQLPRSPRPLRAPHAPPTERVSRAPLGELSPQHAATTSAACVACRHRCGRGERCARGATAGAKRQDRGNPAVQTKRPPYVRNHSPVPSARQHNAPLCARETGLCTQRGNGRLSPRGIIADRNQMQEPAALVAPVAIGQLGHPTGEPGPRAGGFELLWHRRRSPDLGRNARRTGREGLRRALGTARAGIIQDTVQHPPAPKTDSQLYVRCLCAHHTWCRRSEAAL